MVCLTSALVECKEVLYFPGLWNVGTSVEMVEDIWPLVSTSLALDYKLQVSRPEVLGSLTDIFLLQAVLCLGVVWVSVPLESVLFWTCINIWAKPCLCTQGDQ